jgi:iron complex transport system substrate-binding protein
VRESGSDAREAGSVRRQAEAQQIVRPVETATPDPLMRKSLVDTRRIVMSHQTKQCCTANKLAAPVHQHLVKPARLLLQSVSRAICPSVITQGRGPDLQRRSGASPWSECDGDLLRDARRGDGKAEPHTGKSVELSERAEDHDRQALTELGCADRRIAIGKGFIENQPTKTRFHQRSDGSKRGLVDDAAVRIVGIDDHDVARMRRNRVDPIHGNHLMPGIAPGRGMFVVGRANYSDGAATREIGQPLDQGLRAGSRDDVGAIRHTIACSRGGLQRLRIGLRRQTLPCSMTDIDDRPRPRIDAGGKIEPRFRRAAKARHRLSEIATMFHGRFMPSTAAKREKFWLQVAAIALMTAVSPQHAKAAEPQRFASINLCTDQLLVTLADPDQILGLSPYARDPARSWDAEKAKQFAKLSGDAEEVLMLQPDVVLAGRFTKRATRELLKDKGLRVVELDPARSLDDVKKQLRQMGTLVGHPERAVIEITKLDAAIARARAVATRKPYRVLAVSRRGWVSGGENLNTSLLAAVGLSNAGGELGFKAGGYASLEAIVSMRPDFLLVADDSGFAEDEGRAFLLHPALEKFYPPSRRIVLPERLTTCGGPTLAEALDRLSSELQRVDR